MLISIEHDPQDISENTLTNFFIPLGIAPNFLIDNKNYTIPMAIEDINNNIFDIYIKFHININIDINVNISINININTIS